MLFESYLPLWNYVFPFQPLPETKRMALEVSPVGEGSPPPKGIKSAFSPGWG